MVMVFVCDKEDGRRGKKENWWTLDEMMPCLDRSLLALGSERVYIYLYIWNYMYTTWVYWPLSSPETIAR